jgi:beta-glucosidase
MRKKLGIAAGLLLVVVGALLFPWFGARRTDLYLSPDTTAPPYLFPKDFLWGAATAAHQVESSQENDWTAFEREVMAHRRFDRLGPGQARPGHIHELGRYPETVRQQKTGYDTRYAEDLAQAAALGHNAYRFSIEWSRLFPREDMTEPDPAGVAFYDGVLAALERARLYPSVTLFHFTTPAWLWQERGGQRGFERADALAHFERFVRAVAQRFGGRISHYCTLNEPMVYIYNGYLEGVFPPHERRGDPAKITRLFSQLLRAHALAYRILKDDARRRGREVLVGYTQHTRAFAPYRNWAPLDRLTAQMIEQVFMWDLPDAVQSGVIQLKSTPYREEIPGLAGTQDYLGVNYYGRFYVKTDLFHPLAFQILMNDPKKKDERKSDLGWAEYPHGFADILLKAHRRYRLPIYVLENGTADGQDDDRDRQRFLLAHVKEMWHARQAGADIRGYFHWSLIDNFEWAEGFGARFGLIKVDYENGFRRTPRPSAALYRQIIQAGGLDATLAQRLQEMVGRR